MCAPQLAWLRDGAPHNLMHALTEQLRTALEQGGEAARKAWDEAIVSRETDPMCAAPLASLKGKCPSRVWKQLSATEASRIIARAVTPLSLTVEGGKGKGERQKSRQEEMEKNV